MKTFFANLQSMLAHVPLVQLPSERLMTLGRMLLIICASATVSIAIEMARVYWRKRSEPNFYIAEDDPRMLEAINLARASLPIFWEAFKTKRPMDTAFGLKCQFEFGNYCEHIWCDPIEVKDNSVSVRIANIPDHLPYAEGDIVEISPNQITDWLVVRNGEPLGGQTQKVLDLIASDPPNKQQSAGFSEY